MCQYFEDYDILLLILSYLPKNDLNNFIGTNKHICKNILDDQYLWKLRLENIFNLFSKDNIDYKSTCIFIDNNKSLEDNYINAIELNVSDVVKILLENNIEHFSNDWPIRHAAENGYYKIIELLLKDGRIDPSDYHNNVIRIASREGHYEIVELLLNDTRVDASDFDNGAFKNALRTYNYKIMKLLLENSRVVSKLEPYEYNYYFKLCQKKLK
jgi:hypothetical protein